jgi:hypothetical protein
LGLLGDLGRSAPSSDMYILWPKIVSSYYDRVSMYFLFKLSESIVMFKLFYCCAAPPLSC